MSGDGVTSVTLNSTGAASSANAGDHPITASAATGSGLDNYDITYVDGNLHKDKAASTTVLTWAAGPYPYTGAAYTATAQVTGPNGLSTDLTAQIVYTGECTLPTIAPYTTECVATATYAASTNYLTSTDSKSIQIDPVVPEGSVVPPPPPPSAGIVVTIVGTAVTLSWADGTTPGTYPAYSYIVNYKYANWNGTFGAYQSTTISAPTPLTALTAPAKIAGITAALGRTYCFNVQSVDRFGHKSAVTTDKCTALPLDDRGLTRSSGWSLKTSSAYYNGTYLYTTTYGKYLTRTLVQAKSIAIIATTCSTCGSLKVYWNGKLIKTVSLKSTKTVYKKVITVAAFKVATKGTLKIVVATSGKKIYFDGVRISRV